jgi:hypothetical protein
LDGCGDLGKQSWSSGPVDGDVFEGVAFRYPVDRDVPARFLPCGGGEAGAVGAVDPYLAASDDPRGEFAGTG